MNKAKLILAQLLFVFSLVTITEVFADQCAVDIMPETWATKLSASKHEQTEYLAALKRGNSHENANWLEHLLT